jgi:predicted transcriptional regulator
MARKRSRIDIIADMLVSIQQNGGVIKPTHLMYKSNLSYRQMNSYLEELLESELIRKVSRQKYEYISITDRGFDFLQKFREMREFEKAFGL